MEKTILGILKVLLATFLTSYIWVILYPYEAENLTPLDFFYLIGYTIHSFALYFLLRAGFWVFREKYPSYFSFSNIFIVILALWSIFILIYIPYGPDLGIFYLLRILGVLN